METLVQVVRSASDYATAWELRAKRRTLYSVLASVTAELGELAEEVAIKSGDSYKKEGPDGVIGEAIDVIIAALDIITISNPELTEDEIARMAQLKCEKWISKIATS